MSQDGTRVPSKVRRIAYGLSDSPDEARTASELVRRVPPRALPKERALVAFRLSKREGLSTREIANRLGVCLQVVQRWIRDVREEGLGES